MKERIKAIETEYNGYKFRSRLEARWAVFMDSLGVRYDFEPEGYNLDGLFYVPDFFLLDIDCFFEVKGLKPSKQEEEKARKLSEATGKRVLIAMGRIPDGGAHDHADGATPYGMIHLWGNGGWDCHYCWCECPGCGDIGIEFDGRAARIACGCGYVPPGNPDKGYNWDSPRLLAAYDKARKQRFWNPAENRAPSRASYRPTEAPQPAPKGITLPQAPRPTGPMPPQLELALRQEVKETEKWCDNKSRYTPVIVWRCQTGQLRDTEGLGRWKRLPNPFLVRLESDEDCEDMEFAVNRCTEDKNNRAEVYYVWDWCKQVWAAPPEGMAPSTPPDGLAWDLLAYGDCDGDGIFEYHPAYFDDEVQKHVCFRCEQALVMNTDWAVCDSCRSNMG